MPADIFTNTDSVVLSGAVAIKANGIGNTSLSLPQGIITPQALATGTAVIAIPASQIVVRVSAAAATTGASLPAGTVAGQLLIIVITTAAANTVTFAAAGTSNVAGGAAVSMAGLAAHAFVWDATGALWYQCGPLAN